MHDVNWRDNNKQIMTGLEGNRQICLPREIRMVSPRVSIDRGAAEVNRNSHSWEVILNLKGQIGIPYYPRDQSLFVLLNHYVTQKKNDYFNWKLISSTMGLITKNTRLNDHKLFLRIIIMKNNINSN